MLVLQSVAKPPDKYNVNGIYDNHHSILLHGLIHKEEQDFLLFYSKITRPILLEMAGDPSMHMQKHGGQIGGIKQ